MAEEKSILGKMPMREKQPGAHPAGAWEEMRMRHEAAMAKAVGVAEAIRGVRHVGADKAVERGRAGIRGNVANNRRRGLLNDNPCGWPWRHSGQHRAGQFTSQSNLALGCLQAAFEPA